MFPNESKSEEKLVGFKFKLSRTRITEANKNKVDKKLGKGVKDSGCK